MTALTTVLRRETVAVVNMMLFCLGERRSFAVNGERESRVVTAMCGERVG